LNKQLALMTVAALVLTLGFLLDQSLLNEIRKDKEVLFAMEREQILLEKASMLLPVDMSGNTLFNRIGGWAYASEKGVLFEVGVYDEHFRRCVSSGVQSWPQEGPFEIAIPEWKPGQGRYYLAITVNGSAVLGAWPGKVQPLTGHGFPLPIKAGSHGILHSGSYGPMLSLLPKSHEPSQVIRELNTKGDVFAMCRDPTSHRMYGQRGERVFSSVDCGKTWQAFMSLPQMAGHTFGMLSSGDRLYVLSSFGELFESEASPDHSNLETGWRNITCPEPLRRSITGALPYGLISFQDHLYLGEYTTTARGEVRNREKDEGACRILRYNPKTGRWRLSGEFKARHIHAFFTNGKTLWASIGDLNSGPQVGIARMKVNDCGLEAWEMVNGFGEPFTDNYGVSFIDLPKNPLLILSGDRPGRHLMAVRTDLPAGQANIDTLVYGPNQEQGTVRSVIMDHASKALFYWTAETDHPALYYCPPPYRESFPIHRYKEEQVLLKAFQCHDAILMRDQRFVVNR